LITTGCAPKKKLAIEDSITDEAPEEEISEEPQEEDIRISQDWSEIPALGTINFEYDAAKLDADAKATLKKNVGVIKKLPESVMVRVEGHCDDRGTIEYNIALGQRRANSVRAYYKTAGIDVKRIETISYGEERPLCNYQTDGCWARNRRAVTKVRNKEPISINPSDLE
jgi:peptidoglycan-associated lipoprotein